MSDKTRLDDATLAKIDTIAADVAEIKRLLRAMATAFDMREVVEGNAAVEAQRDSDERARQEFEERRKRRIVLLLGSYEGPRGGACRKWLEEQIGTQYGPLRDEEITHYSKLQDAPG